MLPYRLRKLQVRNFLLSILFIAMVGVVGLWNSFPPARRKRSETYPAPMKLIGTNESTKQIFGEREDNLEMDKLLTMLGLTYTEESNEKSEETENLLRNLASAPKFVVKNRLVHLDLKGAPPHVSFLAQLLPLFRDLGATGILLEYEDMFPYWSDLEKIAATNAYSADEIKSIQKIAYQNGLEVIPLIQTFGHLEFLLKHPDFKDLREVTTFPQAICPSNNRSFSVIRKMLDQVIKFHPQSKRIHIGCDEVYFLGRCSKCIKASQSEKATSYLYPTDHVFIEHVRRITEYVKSQHGLDVIVWDDMFRTMPLGDLQRSGLGSLVEPMVWAYSEDVQAAISRDVLDKYSKAFGHVWAAGAYKGAFGETLYVPPATRHLINTAQWIEMLRRLAAYNDESLVRGVVLTGWQRYDHFSILCELLPVAIPSLALSLATLTNGRFEESLFQTVARSLQCPVNAPVLTIESLIREPRLWRLGNCNFPGDRAFQMIHSLDRIKPLAGQFIKDITQKDGWFNPYNVKRSFSSPFRTSKADKQCQALIITAQAVKKNAYQSLRRYYDKDTTEEWIEQQIDPALNSLRYIAEQIKKMLSKETWPVRPL